MLTLPHHLQSAPPTLSILCRQYTESVAVVTLSRKLYQAVAMANKPQSAPGSTSKVRIWPVNLTVPRVPAVAVPDREFRRVCGKPSFL